MSDDTGETTIQEPRRPRRGWSFKAFTRSFAERRVSPPVLKEFDPIEWKKDLMRMLRYATSQPNLSLEASIFDKLKDNFDPESPDIPAELWKVYDTLATAIRPATVASLTHAEQYSVRTNWKFRDFIPFTEKTQFVSIMVGNTTWLFLSFLITLIFQIHTSIGVNFDKQLNDTILAVKNAQSEDLRMITLEMASWNNSRLSRLATLFELDRRNTPEITQDDNNTNKALPYVQEKIAYAILTSLSLHILPTLYGFLGACAFIARSLYESINNSSFLPGKRFSYSLRRFLGMALGFSAGMFWDITNKNLADSKLLTLAAFAFLMGYSIEAMFAMLDALVSKVRDSFKSGPKASDPPTTVKIPT